MLTCPNDACRKVFTEPLTTINLQQSSKEQYNACPYCLTEITITETENPDPTEKESTENAFLEEKPDQSQEKISSCTHYFGYMSEKEHKLQMPDECMLCSQIIKCMIKENGSAKKTT
jgi:hypothetical protein